jgi:hypothetical protein
VEVLVGVFVTVEVEVLVGVLVMGVEVEVLVGVLVMGVEVDVDVLVGVSVGVDGPTSTVPGDQEAWIAIPF